MLRVTRSRSPSIFIYTLHGTPLKSTESTKYLGVTLTKDLTWGKHVDNIRAKANQQLAFVRRNIRTRSSSTKEKLYNTLVRPHIAMLRLSGTRTSPNRSIHLGWSNEELRDVSLAYTITPQVSQTCFTS